MVKHMEAKFGVLPNVFIYNALLDAASGDLHAALRVRVPQSPPFHEQIIWLVWPLHRDDRNWAAQVRGHRTCCRHQPQLCSGQRRG
jgi:hypothetical protein